MLTVAQCKYQVNRSSTIYGNSAGTLLSVVLLSQLKQLALANLNTTERWVLYITDNTKLALSIHRGIMYDLPEVSQTMHATALHACNSLHKDTYTYITQ